MIPAVFWSAMKSIGLSLLTRPFVVVNDAANGLWRNTKLRCYIASTLAIFHQPADFIITPGHCAENFVYVVKAFVCGLTLDHEKRIHQAYHLCALFHVSHSPNPQVAIVDAIWLTSSALAPYATSHNSRIDGVDHALVGIADTDTHGTGFLILRLCSRNPACSLAVDNAGEPTDPLVVSHGWDWMDRSVWWSYAFHKNNYTTTQHYCGAAKWKYCGWACGIAAALSRAVKQADPQSRTVIDLFCGGGLGALGWHQRYWEYLDAQGKEVS